MLPALERALLAGHDLVLLGERGQGKTRLMRTLVSLLDEWTPVVDGCEINDHPEAPVCARCRRLHAELGLLDPDWSPHGTADPVLDDDESRDLALRLAREAIVGSAIAAALALMLTALFTVAGVAGVFLMASGGKCG